MTVPVTLSALTNLASRANPSTFDAYADALWTQLADLMDDLNTLTAWLETAPGAAIDNRILALASGGIMQYAVSSLTYGYRFANGIQICHKRSIFDNSSPSLVGPLYKANAAGVGVFPFTFSSVPVMFVSNEPYTSLPYLVEAEGVSATGYNVYGYSGVTTETGGTYQATAFGRWDE